MIIEVLFNEFSLYGEKMNIKYFQSLFPTETFIMTRYDQEPYFVSNHVDMIMINPMSNTDLELVFHKLLPYQSRLKELIDANVIFYLCQNVLDIMGESLVEDGKPLETLKLLPLKTVRKMRRRHLQVISGTFEGVEFIGTRNGFSYLEVPKEYALYQLNNGELGGVRYKNVFGVDFLDNLFINNPFITKWVKKQLTGNQDILHESLLMKAYHEKSRLLQERKHVKH